MQAAGDMRQANLTGIALMCAGVFCLSINDAIAKTLTEDYTAWQIAFLRNVIALPVVLLITLRMGGTAALRSYRPVTHLWRGALWVIGTFCFFTSLKYLGLAEATALIFVAPVLVTALSALIFREEVGARRWTAVLLGLLGVVIVVRPGGEAFQPAALLVLGTAFLYALMLLSARFVDPRESVWTLSLYLTGSGALIGVFIQPFIWVPVAPDDLWLFGGSAIFGTAGMTMMTQAFRFATPAVVAPLDYTALIWASILGYVFWAEIPDLFTYLGAAVIIASGIYIVMRERALGKDPVPERPAP